MSSVDDGAPVEQWRHPMPTSRWYVRPDGHGGFVAYVEESPLDNPVWVALCGAVIFIGSGLELDLPEGVTVDDIEAYTRMVWPMVDQEVIISQRQAEEFCQIVRSMKERHPQRMSYEHRTAAAVDVTLRVLGGVSDG